MTNSDNLDFTLQVSLPGSEARRVQRLARDLLADIREARLGSAFLAPVEQSASDEGESGPLWWGNLRIVVVPADLPPLYAFINEWALQRAGLIVRLRLQARARSGSSDSAALERYHSLTLRGRAGQSEDVDHLMALLADAEDLATTRLVDFALSLVKSEAGQARLAHYLFEGELIQRNYAALYFKRLGRRDILEQAVQAGRVSAEQAFNQ